MRTTRRLTLHRERLAELSPRDLDRVAGGTTRADSCGLVTAAGCPSLDFCPTIPVRDCPGLTGRLTCYGCEV